MFIKVEIPQVEEIKRLLFDVEELTKELETKIDKIQRLKHEVTMIINQSSKSDD